MSSLKDPKLCEDHNGTNVRPQEESQPTVSHISQFLPTSRRIVQFSNGKVFGWLCHLLFQRYSVYLVHNSTNQFGFH